MRTSCQSKVRQHIAAVGHNQSVATISAQVGCPAANEEATFELSAAPMRLL
jgi:hypothetical protein